MCQIAHTEAFETREQQIHDRAYYSGWRTARAQCDALVHAAEQVIAHLGESDEQDGKLLLDLAVAVDQARRSQS